MVISGLFRTALVIVLRMKMWDVFHPPAFLGVPAFEQGAGFTPGPVKLVANEPRFPVAPPFFPFLFFNLQQCRMVIVMVATPSVQ